MIEVPLGRGGQGAFEADEERLFLGFVEVAEAFDGGVFDGFVPGETGEGAAFAVGDFIDGVFGEVGAVGAGVVELEAALEEHFVEDRLLGIVGQGEKRGGFLVLDVALERLDVLLLAQLGIRRELAAREVRLAELVNLEAGVGKWLRIVAVALDDAFDALDGDG